MLPHLRWFTFVLLFIYTGSCTPVPEATIYEAEGIISISNSNIQFDEAWKRTKHLSSFPMQLQSSELSLATSRFYVQSPGEYSLWILGASTVLPDSGSSVHVTVTGREGFLQHQGTISPQNTEYLQWTPADRNKTEAIRFESSGFYEIKLAFQGYQGFMLEKLHLSRNNEIPPSGFGLPATVEHDLDPRLLKRQQPVMLPPAWAFGTLVWPQNNERSVVESVLADGIVPDAVLQYPVDPDSVALVPKKWLFNKSIYSVNVSDSSGVASNHDDWAYEGPRRFFISGIQDLYDPDFKKIPAKWHHVHAGLQNADSAFEILEKRIESVANPRMATYEAPFLTSGLDPNIINTYGDNLTDEVMMRWIQFSALTGLMHLYIPAKSGSMPFSSVVVEEIREMAELRSRLFPYLYSLAHLVRATAENPVRGDGDHPAQYQLGEALLIAPVYREGVESRSVWFPEGTWYNYGSGERYEGGQTWLIDTPVSEIPLFVKAGSIIPYRSNAGQIMQGSNNRLMIEIYTGGVGTFRLYEDDGVTNRYRNGEIATTGFRYFETDGYSTFTIGQTVGDFEGKLKERTLEIQFLYSSKPKRVIANSNTLQQGDDMGEWQYSEENETLTILWNQSTDLKTDFEIRY
jgi:hypothetical protein